MPTSQGSSPPSGDDSNMTAHIRVKPPTFDESSATRWFQILESQFIISKITVSSTKFHHALSNLPLNVLKKLDDTMITCNDYDVLKDKIITMFTKPAPELFDNIVSQHHLTCQKPSVYLNELKQIAVQSNLGLTDDFLKIKFLKGLPDSIRPILVSHNASTLDELARFADTLISFMPVQSSISHISRPPRKPSNVRFSNNDNPNYNPSYNRSHNPSPNNGPYSRNPSTPMTQYHDDSIPINIRAFNHKQRPQICRFHLYYGPRARSCKQWCMLASTSSNVLPHSRSSSPAPNRQSGN